MNCFLCGREHLISFVDLGIQPLANGYLSHLEDPDPQFSLQVHICEDCLLVQTANNINPKKIFNEDYAFLSAQSTAWLTHCDQYVRKINKWFINKAEHHFTRICEIGSNDGCLLQKLKEAAPQVSVLGVDPAESAALVARRKGLEIDTSFWGPETGEKYRNRFDLIIANNVLAHTPDPVGFVEGISLALAPKGIATIEVPYFKNIVDGNNFDTIYHEHYSYFTMHTLIKVLCASGLYPFEVEHLPIHGGSLRVYICHLTNHHLIPRSYGPHNRVNNLCDDEEADGMTNVDYYLQYSSEPLKFKGKLLNILNRLQDKKIVIYGTPAKGNTLLNYCGIDSSRVDYAVDSTPYKQGKFLPGSHIPIYHPNMISITKPDIIWILPWNWQDEIIEKLDQINDWGARYLVKDRLV